MSTNPIVMDDAAIRALPEGTLLKELGDDNNSDWIFERFDVDGAPRLRRVFPPELVAEKGATHGPVVGITVLWQPAKVLNPEILGEFVDPLPTGPHPTKVGQRVVVIDAGGATEAKLGAYATVTRFDPEDAYTAELAEVVQDDGARYGMFVHRFAVIEDVPQSFKVGDRVVVNDNCQIKHERGMKGTVRTVRTERWGATPTNPVITVTMDGYGTLGYRPKSLTLLDCQAELEDFTFEAGQEIGSVDVLGDLPTGTVLYLDGTEMTPITKLATGIFVRVNMWADKSDLSKPHNLTYDLSDDLKRVIAAEAGRPVMIGYVPA